MKKVCLSLLMGLMVQNDLLGRHWKKCNGSTNRNNGR